MTLSKAYLEIYNTPNLKTMLESNTQDNAIIEEILEKRASTFWEDVSTSAEYHSNN